MARSLRVFWKRHFQGKYQRYVFTFASMHATVADVIFYDGPGMHTVKEAKQVYNSTLIALLKYGFVLVKTWLLIACGTGFSAIIPVKKWRYRKKINDVNTTSYQRYACNVNGFRQMNSPDMFPSKMEISEKWDRSSCKSVTLPKTETATTNHA